MTPIAEGLAFPEGPVALPDGSLAVVEIAAGRVTHIDARGVTRTLAEPGGGPNGAALGPDGRLYVCNCGGFDFVRTRDGRLRVSGIAADYRGGRIERIDLTTGRVDALYVSTPEIPLNAPNDIVFDDRGGFWFTDHGHQRGRSHDMGAVYFARADGSSLREVAFPLLTPNGIGRSPEGTRVYVSETLTGRLRVYGVGAEGALTPQSWPRAQSPAISFVEHHLFDSMAIEANGAIAVASLGKGGVVVLSPEGALIEEVLFPDPLTTNICFAGADMRDAYATLSSTGVVMKTRWNRPGLELRHG